MVMEQGHPLPARCQLPCRRDNWRSWLQTGICPHFDSQLAALMTQHLNDASYEYRQQERADLRWGAGARAAWQTLRLHSTARCSIAHRRSGRQSSSPVSAIDSRKLRHRPFRRTHGTKHNSQQKEYRRGLLLPVSRPDSTQDAERVRCRCTLPSWQSERKEEWLWLKARSPWPCLVSRAGRLMPTLVAQSRKVVEHAQEIGGRQADPALPLSAD